jgi:hypothetical protein
MVGLRLCAEEQEAGKLETPAWVDEAEVPKRCARITALASKPAPQIAPD